MRMIGPVLVLLVAAAPVLAQTAAPTAPQSTPREQGSGTDRPKRDDLQFLLPALKLLQDANRRADEESRRKKETEAAPPAIETPTAEPAPVTVTPAAADTTPEPVRPVLRKPGVPTRNPVVAVPRQKPDIPSAAAPSAEPVQATAPAATPPPIRIKMPPAVRKPLPSPSNSLVDLPGAFVIAGLLMLLAAAAYAARRVLGFASALPHVKAQLDAGSVSAPAFDDALPAISLAIGAGAFTTATDYPQGAGAA